jgi:hypothetical protein
MQASVSVTPGWDGHSATESLPTIRISSLSRLSFLVLSKLSPDDSMLRRSFSFVVFLSVALLAGGRRCAPCQHVSRLVGRPGHAARCLESARPACSPAGYGLLHTRPGRTGGRGASDATCRWDSAVAPSLGVGWREKRWQGWKASYTVDVDYVLYDYKCIQLIQHCSQIHSTAGLPPSGRKAMLQGNTITKHVHIYIYHRVLTATSGVSAADLLTCLLRLGQCGIPEGLDRTSSSESEPN